MDNACYQHCKPVKEHALTLDIELLFLPACSPNLKLVERGWKLTKKKFLTNKYHRDFQGFRSAIDQCLDDFEDKLKPEPKTPLTLNFRFFPFHKSSRYTTKFSDIGNLVTSRKKSASWLANSDGIRSIWWRLSKPWRKTLLARYPCDLSFIPVSLSSLRPQ